MLILVLALSQNAPEPFEDRSHSGGVPLRKVYSNLKEAVCGQLGGNSGRQYGHC